MSNPHAYPFLAWVRTPVNASVRFVLQGPTWMPITVRRVPLRVCCFVVDVQLRLRAWVNGVSGS